MKKLSLLISAFALAAMVSCSSDQVVSSQNDAAILSKQSISFAPLASKATRSTVFSPDAMFTNFRVVGMWRDAVTEAYINGVHYGGSGTAWGVAPAANGLYEGFDANTPKGLEIVNSGTGWDYKNQSEIQYWPYEGIGGATPTGYNCIALNFRAVAPANTNLDIATGSDFSYTTPAVANQVDICYAEATNKTVADAPVQMAFHHLFSQIVFKAKKSSNYLVDIKSIEIGGVGTTVTYPFSQIIKTDPICLTVQGVSVTAPAVFHGLTSASYVSIPDQDASASPAQMTPSGQELILIPQQITKWDHTAAATAADGYIAIEYRAKTTDAASWATGTAGTDYFKKVYFPLTAKWYSGKKYIYTLLFGGVADPDEPDTPDPENPDPGTGEDNPGGYDEDGTPEPPTVPITFTASVSDWTEQVVDIDF